MGRTRNSEDLDTILTLIDENEDQRIDVTCAKLASSLKVILRPEHLPYLKPRGLYILGFRFLTWFFKISYIYGQNTLWLLFMRSI